MIERTEWCRVLSLTENWPTFCSDADRKLTQVFYLSCLICRQELYTGDHHGNVGLAYGVA